MNYSILFKDKETKLNIKMPSFFTDLKLDQIKDALYYSDADKYLVPYFYTALNNLEDIKYRQEVFKEFSNKEIYQKIKQFFIRLLTIYNAYIENKEANDNYSNKSRRLKIMNEYIKIVNDINSYLSNVNFNSLALNRMKDWFNEYINGKEFKSFVLRIDEVKKILDGIKFTFILKGNEIFVDETHDNDKDFSIKINEITSVFTYERHNHIPDANFEPTPTVDEEIYAKLSKLYKKEFIKIIEFFDSNKEFYSLELLKIVKEIRFYFTYIQLIDKISNDNLRFSIPEVSLDYDEISTESYDLALAIKFNFEKRIVVTNSYELKGNERMIILTGPNQGGKTTFSRQLGQIHYLARLGVPIQGINNKIHLIDNIYTSYKTEENIDTLDGKLKIELNAVKEILDKSSSNSLILFNEIFASTTKVDGEDISNLILDKINNIGCICLFVTFLTELSKRNDVTVLSSNVDPNNNELRTYKITRTLLLGSAYPSSIQAKYGLTYDKIRRDLDEN